jgi:hypothetical protein
MSATAAGRLFILLWGAGFILGGLLFATLGYFEAKEALQSGSWPSVEGEVLSQKIDVQRSRDSDGDRTINYRPQVTYQFEVEGKLYQGSRLQIGQPSYNSRAKAAKAMKRLTEGDRCTVFYDPDNPKTCTLEAGLQFHHVLFVGFGLLFCVVGVGGSWLFLANTGNQNSKKKRPASTAKRSNSGEQRPRPTHPALDGPRAKMLEENITRWGREHIGSGDDTPVDWEIISSFDDGHLSYVEVEPFPNEVGYDKFIFVISFKIQPPDLIATYCLEGGQFLLFSRNTDTDEELPDELSGS